MKEKLTIEMQLDDYMKPKIYFNPTPDDKDNWMSLTDESCDLFTKHAKCSPLLTQALIALQVEIGESLCAIRNDMADLYKDIKVLKGEK